MTLINANQLFTLYSIIIEYIKSSNFFTFTWVHFWRNLSALNWVQFWHVIIEYHFSVLLHPCLHDIPAHILGSWNCFLHLQFIYRKNASVQNAEALNSP